MDAVKQDAAAPDLVKVRSDAENWADSWMPVDYEAAAESALEWLARFGFEIGSEHDEHDEAVITAFCESACIEVGLLLFNAITIR